MSKDAILAAYVEKWGQDGLTVPPNRGALRAIYLFPLTAIAAGGVGLAVLLRRWRSGSPRTHRRPRQRPRRRGRPATSTMPASTRS